MIVTDSSLTRIYIHNFIDMYRCSIHYSNHNYSVRLRTKTPLSLLVIIYMYENKFRRTYANSLLYSLQFE